MTSRAVWFSLTATVSLLLVGGILLGLGATFWGLFLSVSSVATGLFFLITALVSSSARRDLRLDRLLVSTRNLENQLAAGRKDLARIEHLLESVQNLEQEALVEQEVVTRIEQLLKSVQNLEQKALGEQEVITRIGHLLKSTRNLERQAIAGQKALTRTEPLLKTLSSLQKRSHSEEVRIRRELARIRMWAISVSDERKHQEEASKTAKEEQLQAKRWALQVLEATEDPPTVERQNGAAERGA